MASHPSSSNEQQKLGVLLVEALSNQLQISLEGKEIKFGDGCLVQIDGYSDDPPIICEAWAHVGKPKGSQPDKVMSDTIKMIFCEKRLGKKFRKILAFSDDVASRHFIGQSWQAAFLRENDIELVVLPLPSYLLNQVKEAQRRQYR